MDWNAFYGFALNLIGDSGKDILWWQMCIRAACVFLFGLVVIRLFGRRAFGKQTPLDIVFAIVIGSNLSRALTGNARFVPTLAATAALAILFWLFDHIAVRWEWFSRLVKGAPINLIRDGRPDENRMRRAGISENDIDEAARRAGLNGLSDVDEAVLERSGKISTIRFRKGHGGAG